MASTTRGSIKISTANGIGAALVDVLGGEGYKPNEWEQSINICGIHAADIESALENIEEDAGTGAERGSILLSTANAIGATLNKKFNTSRGFSPREWASAASKLEPLPEKTASGAIAHIEDGADGVPLKNWLVTLPASLDGYTEVSGVRSGKNLLPNELTTQTLNGTTFTVNADGSITVSGTPSAQTRVYISRETFEIVENMYFSFGTMSTGTRVFGSRTLNGSTTYPTLSPSVNATIGSTYTNLLLEINTTFDGTAFTVYPMLEVGSTATAYEAYKAPTQYTASIGRTIYGGTADIVKGEGEDCYGYVDLGAFTWVKVTSNVEKPYFSTTSALNPAYKYMNSNPNVKCSNYSYGSIGSTGTANGFYIIVSSYVRIRDDATENMTVDEFKTFVTGTKLVYELATPVTFTFEPITPTPETALGSNNFWSDQGESAVTYRKDLDISDPVPGNLLGMNNINNNEEESEG